MTTLRRFLVVAATAAVPPLVLAAGGSDATTLMTCAEFHWVAAWGAAPGYAGDAVENQSLREVVTPTLGGNSARVRLTNRFGRVPVTIDAVYLGRRAAGAGVVTGTSRRVTFGGQTAVTIPAGADLASDSVAVDVKAFQDLAVTLFAAASTGPATIHPFAGRTATYTASGDHAAEDDGAAFASTVTRAWYFLSGVDVFADGRAGAVVALGDSITGSYRDDTRWPDLLARRLARAGRTLSVINAGLNGNRVLRDATYPPAGPSALSRVALDVLATPRVGTVIVLEGINDIGQRPPATAPRLIAGLRKLVARLRARGLRVFLGTLTPSGGNMRGFGTRATVQTRDAVNRWIRRSATADGVIDFDAALRDPAAPGRLRPRYDSGDHLHPSRAGNQRLAGAVDPKRLRGPAC
jgi:lysophospholipase L1-like esterase